MIIPKLLVKLVEEEWERWERWKPILKQLNVFPLRGEWGGGGHGRRGPSRGSGKKSPLLACKTS